MTAVAGDITTYEGRSLVVVDVSDEQGVAVCREPEDMELEKPIVLPLEGLEVWGHNEDVPGWKQTEHGVWEKA